MNTNIVYLLKVCIGIEKIKWRNLKWYQILILILLETVCLLVLIISAVALS